MGAVMESETRVEARENYLNAAHTVKSWLLTTDHKRIALLYLITITVFFFIGGLFAAVIRLELLTPKGIWSRRRLTTACSPCTA